MTTETLLAEGATRRTAVGRRSPRTATAFAWELRKLRAQRRTWLGLAGALLVPLAATAGLGSGDGADGVPLADAIRESGLVVPIIALHLGSMFLLPLVVTLVAGDIVAAEDGHGTLKTILTRSADRWQVLAAKAAAAGAYALACLLTGVLGGLVIGVALWGFDPLPTLSGGHVGAGRGLLLVAGATAAFALPLLAVATVAVALSTVTRASAAAVVGTLLLVVAQQVVGGLGALDAVHPYLLTDAFDDWQGLLRDPVDTAPLVHAAWVSVAYAVPAALVALLAFVRRDVAGG